MGSRPASLGSNEAATTTNQMMAAMVQAKSVLKIRIMLYYTESRRLFAFRYLFKRLAVICVVSAK